MLLAHEVLHWTFAPFGIFGAFGALALFLLPFVVLAVVADARGQSKAFALFALFSWPGFLIGLFILLISPDRKQERREPPHDARPGGGRVIGPF